MIYFRAYFFYNCAFTKQVIDLMCIGMWSELDITALHNKNVKYSKTLLADDYLLKLAS